VAVIVETDEQRQWCGEHDRWYCVCGLTPRRRWRNVSCCCDAEAESGEAKGGVCGQIDELELGSSQWRQQRWHAGCESGEGDSRRGEVATACAREAGGIL